jgi:lysophospholipase
MMTLEERFTAPGGWTTGSFYNPATKHTIHHASVRPTQFKALVVCLGGLSEFSEKYHELARDMLARDYAFFTMDWPYQGRSSRLACGPQRRHSDGFETEISDLHKFITEQVRPAAANEDGSHKPVYLIAHSMGGMISLRYLSEHTGLINAAALSAPMLGVPMKKWQVALLSVLHSLRILDSSYVPTMGKDWNEQRRKGDGSEIFSSDPVRDNLHPYWSKTETCLQLGDYTIGWLAAARKSFKAIAQKDYLERIDTPVMLAAAGQDSIVSNEAIRDAAKRLPNSHLLEIPGSQHEILMESDVYRNQFLNGFDKFIQNNTIITATQPA